MGWDGRGGEGRGGGRRGGEGRGGEGRGVEGRGGEGRGGEGRLAIAPKVTWHNMKCVVPVIKEKLYYTITSKKFSSWHIFEKK